MEFSPLENLPWYAQSREIVNALGYELLGLNVIAPSGSRGISRVSAVIAGRSPEQGIGTEDCAKAHRALQGRLEALGGADGFSMEVASPGMERVITNAAELPLLEGRAARFWDTRSSAWVSGTIKGATADGVTITEGDGGRGSETVLPLDAIAKAKLL